MSDSFWSLGLMSGTSLDGVDAAILHTDGHQILEFGPALSLPYPDSFRKILKKHLGKKLYPKTLESDLTRYHADAVKSLLSQWDRPIDVIGFHGQTLYHAPPVTIQMGDGLLLQDLTNIPVIYDFRTADCQQGGQGAPLVPVYHQALCHDHPHPLAVLNLGGVGNVTYLDGESVIGFDTGPGNALIDDFMQKNLDQPYDLGGKIASLGKPQMDLLSQWLSDPYFKKKYPKSLDRDHFKGVLKGAKGLHGLATLTAFTAFSVFHSLQLIPGFSQNPPKMLIVCGGGRHNQTILHWLRFLLKSTTVVCSDDFGEGWNGDFIEAQAFGFLAVRHLKGLSTSFPSTTGVLVPVVGGRMAKKLS